MRNRMHENATLYISRFELGQSLVGMALAQVIESSHPGYHENEFILGMLPWQDYAVIEPSNLEKINLTTERLLDYLGPLGMPGLTAYVGLAHIDELKRGKTLFVSAAAGAVGNTVCQLAKLYGYTVIASTRSSHKLSYLKEELGLERAFSYENQVDFQNKLKHYGAKGIDISFENVGGFVFEAVMQNLNYQAQIILCGLIAQYNNSNPRLLQSNLSSLLSGKIKLKHFIVNDYLAALPIFREKMLGWLKEGKIKPKEHIVSGLEAMPLAFQGLFTGIKVGKLIIQLG
jgi:NADPH-dependent curcumin reductase CurA